MSHKDTRGDLILRLNAFPRWGAQQVITLTPSFETLTHALNPVHTCYKRRFYKPPILPFSLTAALTRPIDWSTASHWETYQGCCRCCCWCLLYDQLFTPPTRTSKFLSLARCLRNNHDLTPPPFPFSTRVLSQRQHPRAPRSTPPPAREMLFAAFCAFRGFWSSQLCET